MTRKSSDDRGLYHVNTVARLVGLSPATLRAWERRYGLPRPHRGQQGYRLYSEHDVRLVRWLKSQTEAGLTIARAVELLADMRAAGRNPVAEARAAKDWAETPLASRSSPASGSAGVARASLSLERLAEACSAAFEALDETACQGVFQTALALYSPEQLLEQVLTPALVAIGERWHAGQVSVAVEHFATQQVLRQLWALWQAAGQPHRPGRVLAACAPGERHEIGLLMLAVQLRWRGFEVRYLGPDLSLERLEEALARARPDVLLFSATRPEAVAGLAGLADVVRPLSPAPRVVLGGQGAAGAAVPFFPGLVNLGEQGAAAAAAVDRLLAAEGRGNGHAPE